MHWPPQLFSAVQTIVGVHVEPVGQPDALPISVQGITGGGVNIDRQSPPQVIVCVHIEPVGHKLTPPTIHGVGVLVIIGLVPATPFVARTMGRMEKYGVGFILRR